MTAAHLAISTRFLLLSTFIYTVTCQIVTKTAVLTPYNTFTQGARVFTNINDVEAYNGLWSVSVLSQYSWQFIISLDSTYGFDSVDPSSISITVQSPWVAGTDELFFGFTTDNEHFVSMLVPIENPRAFNQIYPACIPSAQSTQSFATGDIAALPGSNRRCNLAHGSCTKWRSMVPNKYDIQMPITFTLQHNPTDHMLEIYFSDQSVTRTVQRCAFASGYSADRGLKLYVAGHNPGDTYIIESFYIQSTIQRPTTAPTPEPTTMGFKKTPHPSYHPTATPTAKPISYKPTNVPTKFTANPTNVPTISTDAPSQAPSAKPTVEGYVWGAFNQLCPQSVTTTGYCRDVNDIYFGDNIVCFHPYDCCMCAQIECGLRDTPCRRMTVGPSGVAGVKDITVVGAATGNGATIECQGAEACYNTDIIGHHVRAIDCDGDRACYNATISITDPSPSFVLDCGGKEACHDLDIEINLNAPEAGCFEMAAAQKFMMDKITCTNNMACENLHITINNAGCGTVVIETLECVQHNACNGAVFDFIGAVEIDHCKCGSSCMNAVGLEQCYQGLAFLKCTDPRACAQQISTVTNPRNGFEFICSDISSCEAATFTIELTHNIPKVTSKLGKFIFGGEYAAMGATFIIDNQQGIDMSIVLVECAGSMACYQTTFILKGNVFIEKFNCASNACGGCMIKRAPGAPGVPCDPTAVQTFGGYPVNSMV